MKKLTNYVKRSTIKKKQTIAKQKKGDRIMWKNSNELLDYANRKLKEAIKEEKEEIVAIKIELTDSFTGNSTEDIQKFAEKLEIKEITKLLREKYANYAIRSTVRGGHMTSLISFKDSPCTIAYKLFWELTLLKKEV